MPWGWWLEAGLSLPVEAPSITQGQDDGCAPVVDPDAGILAVAIELADEALRGLDLTHSAYGGVLSDVCEGVRMRMPYRELMDFARATAMRAAHEPGARDAGDMPASPDIARRRAAG